MVKRLPQGNSGNNRTDRVRGACAKDFLAVVSVLGLAGYGLVELVTHVVGS